MVARNKSQETIDLLSREANNRVAAHSNSWRRKIYKTVADSEGTCAGTRRSATSLTSVRFGRGFACKIGPHRGLGLETLHRQPPCDGHDADGRRPARVATLRTCQIARNELTRSSLTASDWLGKRQAVRNASTKGSHSGVKVDRFRNLDLKTFKSLEYSVLHLRRPSDQSRALSGGCGLDAS